MDDGVILDGQGHGKDDRERNDESWKSSSEVMEVAGKDLDDVWHYHGPGEEHDIRPDVEHLWGVDAGNVVFLIT